MDGVEIPNRPVFRAQEVCELAGLQPYVLRTWEAEFPDLGVSKTSQGPRLYRRGDVERVLLIKRLLFVDGLTLAGARRRMAEEGLLPQAAPDADADMSALADEALRQELQQVRRDLHWMLNVLSGGAGLAGDAPDASEPRPARSAERGRVRPHAKAKPASRTAKAKVSRR
ncbi:MAG: MerR family transcriptional regulator [Acidobacteria bacterium]|nr:MerR family transcriptional regulator [Acidobacteriota bacterium]